MEAVGQGRQYSAGVSRSEGVIETFREWFGETRVRSDVTVAGLAWRYSG